MSAAASGRDATGAPADLPLLRIEGLTVRFGDRPVVEDLSLAVEKGRTLAVVGESGSGKSVTSLSIMRLADMAGASYPAGRILFAGAEGERDLLALPQKAMRRVRGREIAMIFQEPMTSLNPVFTIGDQIAEVLTLHMGMTKKQALAEARRLLDMVRLPDAAALLRRYPHQLSGGMRQRVVIAMALACRPRLLIADEPTTALDVTVQAQILRIVRELQAELGMGLLFITHDMGVVAEMADEVAVMRDGRKVEAGPAQALFARPSHPYTRMLLTAVPRLGSMTGLDLPMRRRLTVIENGVLRQTGEDAAQDTAKREKTPLLSVDGLSVRFPVRRNLFGRPTHVCDAVAGVSFAVHAGETVALVGESGSGKSTIGRTIMQLAEPAAGEIRFEGRPYSSMDAHERHRLKRDIQYIFQDPFASLDPRRTVGFSIAEPIRTHSLATDAGEIAERVASLLTRVGLRPDHASRYPHQFSGGQRQRIAIARALAAEPRLVIADEALSALDVSIQAQVVDLFLELQQERGLAYLFISHDMAVVERVSHRVVVLHAGRFMETGSRRQVFETTAHPYTSRLLAAVPVPDPTRRRNDAGAPSDAPAPSVIRPVDAAAPVARYRAIAPGHLVVCPHDAA